jgi:Cu-Zn family superoxide dismutase
MITALAEFIPGIPKGNEFIGTIWFTQMNIDSPVRVDIDLYGPAKDGFHGLHVHEKNIKNLCRNNNKNVKDCCSLLGGHFNPYPKWSLTNQEGTPHGSHVGDLTFNIEFINKSASLSYFDTLINLFSYHPHNIVGRSVVLHEDEDDTGVFAISSGELTIEQLNTESFITGNAGSRLSCADIKLLQNLI